MPVYNFKTEDLTNHPPAKEFKHRFSDGGVLDEKGTKWVELRKLNPYGENGQKSIKTGNFPQFLYNQMGVNDFFKLVTEPETKNPSPYAGMIERIGRTTIWADDLADNEFLRFMKSPLEYGAAIEDGTFDDIPSRAWIKNYQSSSDTPNPLFKTELPKYMNSVAEVNFSREIPLKLSEIEFRKCCQTAQTVGDVAGALVGKINVVFMDDMYEACKEYFLGCLRIAPEVETTLIGTGLPFDEDDLLNNPMIKVVEYSGDKCPEDKLLGAIHEITDSEFYYKSRNYNPANKYTRSKKMTLVMPKEYKYPLFLEKFAATYHPDYIKLGEEVTPLYVDSVPVDYNSNGYYPSKWKFFGMLVDDRALGITPLNGGFSVGTFYNPSENSTSYFGHYEFIFSFLPFFNRKYIFLKEK